MVATRIADMAVPISGMAKHRPTSWPATVVAPTTAKARQPAPSLRRRPVATATMISVAAAMKQRKVTAPAQPKASTARSMARNEKPQTTARKTYAALSLAFMKEPGKGLALHCRLDRRESGAGLRCVDDLGFLGVVAGQGGLHRID